jgi:hypothetical protein
LFDDGVSTNMPRRWRYEAGAEEKTGETSAGKSLMNCPCRENEGGRMNEECRKFSTTNGHG